MSCIAHIRFYCRGDSNDKLKAIAVVVSGHKGFSNNNEGDGTAFIPEAVVNRFIKSKRFLISKNTW